MIRFLLAAAVTLCCATADAQYRYCHVQKRFVRVHQIAAYREVVAVPFYANGYSSVGLELRNAAIAREVASLLRAEQQRAMPIEQQPPAYSVLERNCVQCHNPSNRSGGLSLLSQDGNWGHLNWEAIYSRVRTADDSMRMPPGRKLDAEDILALSDQRQVVERQPAPIKQELCVDGKCDTGAMDAQEFAAEIDRIIEQRIGEALRQAGLQTAEQRGRDLFAAKCTGCHSGQADRPRFIDDAGNMLELSPRKLVDIYAATKLGSMPPPENAAGEKLPPLNDDEFRDLKAWLVSAGLPE